MKTTTTIALLAVMSLALALAAAFGAWTASRGVEAEVSSGQLCASCHTTGHALGGHSQFDCASCHTIDEGLADQLAWSASGVSALPEHDEVVACVSCHDERPESAVVSEGHRGHASIEGGCTSCHSVMHTDVPPATCESCHAGVEQHGATAEVACTSCHVFAAPALERPDGSVPGDAGIAPHLASFAGFGAGSTSAVHEQPVEGSSRIHGAMDCRRCHDPHQAEEAVVDCESCHRGYLAEQVHAGPAAHGECSGCHEPHGDREHPADCLGCHSYPEQGHGWNATPGAVTDAMRAETAARITHEGNCASCHDPHSSVASEERCVGCHEEQGAALAALPEGSHEACATCHQPHEPQPTAAVCTTCHTDVHARDSNVPQHRDCLSCHEPHHGRPSPREACASCHTGAHAQSQTSVAQHRDCGSCHEEHGRPLGPTAAACASCHAEQSHALSASAGVPAEHRCRSCHEPHRFPGANAAVARCASCHSSTVSLHASHRGDCRSCHEEHGAPLGTASSCTASSCHRAVRPTVAAHDDCSGCHTPHRPAVAALDACASCHADEVRNASRWPRGSAHAGECSACHEHHDETSVPRDRGVTSRAALCQSCHTAQANRSHTGGHDTCVGCHAPHRPPAAASGLGGASGGWWAACSNCHAEQSSAVARAQGTHGQCAACHETPGTPVPTCEGCHTERDRRLAHTVHAEASCASCHATHGSAPPTRTACLTCHEAQQTNHFPDAATCQSCHLFR